MLISIKINELLEKFEEELKLLRKLIIEYWKDTPDVKDGLIDISSNFEIWSKEYLYELLEYYNYNSEDIKKELRRNIICYLNK